MENRYSYTEKLIQIENNSFGPYHIQLYNSQPIKRINISIAYNLIIDSNENLLFMFDLTDCKLLDSTSSLSLFDNNLYHFKQDLQKVHSEIYNKKRRINSDYQLNLLSVINPTMINTITGSILLMFEFEY